ncbi:LLM class flavin-dependent oxidoreductase [Nocardia sp. CA-120079]|uniref:LLM class flavin-dependent oxidoreductase n=1 Tax=Nocardia sp. CA-120079 TaxID=3239974 RepID=UPI003D993155
MPHLRLSFDLRRPEFVTASSAELAATMLDICEWADGLGFDMTYFGEHHGAEDHYLPSPLVAAAAAAGRTSRMRFRPILLTPLYHPIRLAEDIAVADLVSNGRMSPVFAAGYRKQEFDMYHVELSERRERLLEAVEVCKRAWTGEPFDFCGTTVTVTPRPAQHPRPPIIMGGAAEVPSRRAAHLADGFDPAEPKAWEFYRDECLKLGRDPGPWVPRSPTFLYVTHDPDVAWAEVGPNLLHAANTYARWIAQSSMRESEWYPPISSVDELRAGNAYEIVTPERCVEIGRELGPEGHLVLRPLFGGTEPENAWASLRLFESEVLPHLEVPARVP